MNLRIKNIDFKGLFDHEKILSGFEFDAADILNLNLWIQNEKTVTLVVKDSTAYVELDIPCEVEDFKTPVGIRLESQKFFYILHSYLVDDLALMTIAVTQDGDNSTFDIKVGKDKLSLPHILMEDSQLFEISELHDQLVDSMKVKNYDLSLVSIKNSAEFGEAIGSCLPFISSDEKKNNALSIYGDKIIVNDRTHVYIYGGLETGVLKKEYIPLHKKIARVFVQAFSSGLVVNFIVFENRNKAYLETSVMKCVFNNAMSNVAPPAEDDLKAIYPKKKICDINVNALRDTSNFFSGFYSSSLDLDPIILAYDKSNKETLKVLLKDSGVRGGSCSIDRELSVIMDSDNFEVTVINSSLKQFLGKIKKETTAELRADMDKKAKCPKNEHSFGQTG